MPGASDSWITESESHQGRRASPAVIQEMSVNEKNQIIPVDAHLINLAVHHQEAVKMV